MPDATNDPTTLVAAFLDAFADMDFDAALGFVHDDVDDTNVPIGTVRRRAGVREVLEPFFAPIHENEFVISRRAATGAITVRRDDCGLLTAAKIHDAGAA